MQRWLARLAFSFIILAGALAWHVYSAGRDDRPPLPTWRVRVELAGAFLLVILGVAGLRARHQARDLPLPMTPDDDREEGPR
jgi:4-amino-4-deoxy-L-arabinose transferase-like glycosyltransferase